MVDRNLRADAALVQSPTLIFRIIESYGICGRNVSRKTFGSDRAISQRKQCKGLAALKRIWKVPNRTRSGNSVMLAISK
jgi:hypothetical protein